MRPPFFQEGAYLALYFRHFVFPLEDARFQWKGQTVFFTRTQRRGFKLLSTATNEYIHNEDQCPVFKSTEEARAFLTDLLKKYPRQDVYIFKPVKRITAQAQFLIDAVQTLRLPLRIEPFFSIPVVDLAVSRPSTLFLQKTRSKWRRLQKECSVRLVISETFEKQEIEELFRVEERGWKGRSGSALTHNAKTFSFFLDLAEYARSRKNLFLFSLEKANGEPIAFQFFIKREKTLYLVKTGYDEGYRKYSPGMVLTWLVTSWMREHDFETLDFFGPVMDWHLHFDPRLEEYVSLVVSTRTLRSRIYLGYRAFKYYLKKIGLATPKIGKFFLDNDLF